MTTQCGGQEGSVFTEEGQPPADIDTYFSASSSPSRKVRQAYSCPKLQLLLHKSWRKRRLGFRCYDSSPVSLLYGKSCRHFRHAIMEVSKRFCTPFLVHHLIQATVYAPPVHPVRQFDSGRLMHAACQPTEQVPSSSIGGGMAVSRSKRPTMTRHRR